MAISPSHPTQPLHSDLGDILGSDSIQAGDVWTEASLPLYMVNRSKVIPSKPYRKFMSLANLETIALTANQYQTCN
jgi:hypothetical protein